MDITDIRNRLFELSDEKYRAMQSKIVPNVPPESVIGVRIPELRKLALELSVIDPRRRIPDSEAFLADLPHKYYDENVLHAAIISCEKDSGKCVELTDAFAPYIDNWAVCDTIRPRCFKRRPERLYEKIKEWICSDKPYTVRLAFGMLMSYYLGDGFLPEQPEMVIKTMETSPCAGDYYVKMMAAWYFATALAKQYDAVIGCIEQRRLDAWTHNKTIQKAIESYRVTEEHKEYLRSLKVRS